MRLATAALYLSGPPLAAQRASLRVERDGRAPVVLTAEVLSRLATDTVSKSSHGAPPVRYLAVRLVDVLAAAGSPIDSLRIGHAGWIIAALAKDNYSAVFAAGELDPKIGPTRAWIAFARDGAPLAENEAPFQVIVSTDKDGGRSARMVTTLRILDALPAPAKP